MYLRFFYSFHQIVNKGDVVYFLGDFAFGKKSKYENIKSTLRKINEHSEFHCILGNHDYSLKNLLRKYCASISPLKVINIQGQKITLCHYPMHSFSGSHYNNWQLYGHHHRDTNKEITGKRYNISVDANQYRMISFLKIKLKVFFIYDCSQKISAQDHILGINPQIHSGNIIDFLFLIESLFVFLTFKIIPLL